jgi:hypothetical protein
MDDRLEYWQKVGVIAQSTVGGDVKIPPDGRMDLANVVNSSGVSVTLYTRSGTSVSGVTMAGNATHPSSMRLDGRVFSRVIFADANATFVIVPRDAQPTFT